MIDFWIFTGAVAVLIIAFTVILLYIYWSYKDHIDRLSTKLALEAQTRRFVEQDRDVLASKIFAEQPKKNQIKYSN